MNATGEALGQSILVGMLLAMAVAVCLILIDATGIMTLVLVGCLGIICINLLYRMIR